MRDDPIVHGVHELFSLRAQRHVFSRIQTINVGLCDREYFNVVKFSQVLNLWGVGISISIHDIVVEATNHVTIGTIEARPRPRNQSV